MRRFDEALMFVPISRFFGNCVDHNGLASHVFGRVEASQECISEQLGTEAIALNAAVNR